MKIVQIIGGLGNQMFQYSLALALRKRYGNEVAVDTCFFRGYPLHNHYEIDKIFHATLPVASKREVRNALAITILAASTSTACHVRKPNIVRSKPRLSIPMCWKTNELPITMAIGKTIAI